MSKEKYMPLEHPIISSRWNLDIDGLSVSQLFQNNLPKVWTKYEYIHKDGLVYPPKFEDKIKEQVRSMSFLPKNSDGVLNLKNERPSLTSEFLDWYANYQFNPDYVRIWQTAGDGKININVEGFSYEAILWIDPLKRILSSLYTFKPTFKLTTIEKLNI